MAEIIIIQQRSIGNKKEYAFAKSKENQTYYDCVFLTAENNTLTGVSYVDHISIDPKENTIQFKTGQGFSIKKTVNGIKSKEIKPTTANLSRQFCIEKGWIFDNV